MAFRLPPFAFRLITISAWLFVAALPFAAQPQRQEEPVSALPPPVTRSLYRSHWFAFLNAHLEDDAPTAGAELAEIEKAARTVSVKRLSDFARTAVYEGRLAERLGKAGRASRAYEAARRLDEASYDAVVSKIEFLVRQREYGEAVRLVPSAMVNLLATREPRVAVLSSLVLCLSLALAAALLGSALILALRCAPRAVHDVGEIARSAVGQSGTIPIALIVFLLPLAFGLGPVWIVIWWTVLLHAYANGTERRLLLVGLVLFGFLTPLIATIARENILRRSPLYVAAVDLEERREDASAEDGLRQASAVFSEDSDVWFLLGIFAERAGDNDRAVQAYDRAIQASPNDYRPYLNRGNVHFQDGDFAKAIADYGSAAERAPGAPEVFYNLSIARAEAYDFDGQMAAVAKARQLSATDVDSWFRNPTLARVVSAQYGLNRARRRVEEWNAQPKSRRLPGHAPPVSIWRLLLSPFAIGPWLAALLAVGVTRLRGKGPMAHECLRCGKAFCRVCRRPGDSPLYCTDCVRLHIKKEPVGIEAHVTQAKELRRRTRLKDLFCRLGSLVLPGTHDAFAERPALAAARLFGFALGLALVFIGETYFNPRQLPPGGEWRASALVGSLTAIGIWATANLAAWRGSHGS
jgi:tetratricopeptide (TPR) repeat protein